MKVKQKNGISLIVLVITIIVMIILATAIILSLNGSGIIGKAGEARDKTNTSALLESANILSAEWELDSRLGNVTEDADVYITNGLRKNGFTDEQISKLEISKTGVVKLKETTVLASEILKEGDYVIYTDNEGNEIPCVVLYDLESKSNFEIISVDTVGNGLTLNAGSGSITEGLNSYLNTTLASSVRSVDAGDDTFEAEVSLSETEDTLKLTELGINTTTHDYWTAGTYQHDLLYSFLGHIIVTKDGYISTCALYRADEIEGTTTSTGAQTLHLRPIFKLLETVKVNTEGNRDGKSIATAYKLVV